VMVRTVSYEILLIDSGSSFPRRRAAANPESRYMFRIGSGFLVPAFGAPGDYAELINRIPHQMNFATARVTKVR
jgi:hypothetical protein